MSVLFSTSGTANTANGYETLYRNTTGSATTAIGMNALLGNTTGANNSRSATEQA